MIHRLTIYYNYVHIHFNLVHVRFRDQPDQRVLMFNELRLETFMDLNEIVYSVVSRIKRVLLSFIV